MWQAIQYVSGWLSLIAFLAACVTGYLRYTERQKHKLLEALPEADRRAALEALNSQFAVDANNLTKKHQFILVLSQAVLGRLVAPITLVVLAILLAGIWIISIYNGSQTLTGNIFYEKTIGNQTDDPVEGADIKLEGTDLHAFTDASGRFTIPNIPSQVSVRQILITAAGQRHTKDIGTCSECRFYIPRAPSVKNSPVYPLSTKDFKIVSNACATRREGYAKAAQILFSRDVQTEDGFPKIKIKIWTTDSSRIFDSYPVGTLRGLEVHDPSVNDQEYRIVKWQFDSVNGQLMPLRLSLCVASNDAQASLLDLVQGNLWFEKVE